MSAPRLLFDAVLLAVFAVTVFMAWGLSASARAIPLIVAAAGLLLMVGQAVFDWRHREQCNAPIVPGERRAVAWMLAAPALMLLCGLAVGALVYLFLYLRRQATLTWRAAGVVALVTGISLMVLFEQVLNLPLYRGVLWERLLL